QRDDAQVGRERRERVVGDLGPGLGDGRDQRGLSGVGIADQRHVREELELQAEPPLLAGFTLFVKRRRLARRRLKPGVAPSSPAAPGSDPPLAGPDQIDEEAAFVVFYLRSRRHTDDQVLAALAVAVGALPVLAPFGFEMDAAREVDQGRKPLVDLKDPVAAPATV